MVPCNVVEFKTPKGFDLTGLWYGPRKPQRVVIFIHGLTGSVFSTFPRILAPHIADRKTAVLTFNNRGYGIVNKVYKADVESQKASKRIIAGSAHEKFTDCVDDIQGALDFAKKTSGGKVYLVGHSTGCQKSVYWAYKKKSRGVKGIILLAPVSDHAVAQGRNDLKGLVRYARDLVKQDKAHQLIKGEIYDAQRLLSLYTPDSPEELFTYVQPTKQPRILRSVRVPILVLWAAEDEYNDRPVALITDWFGQNIRSYHRIVVVPRAKHSFKGVEKTVAREIRNFIDS